MSESITLNPCLAIEVLLQKHAAVGRINVARGVSLEGRGHRSSKPSSTCSVFGHKLAFATYLALHQIKFAGPLKVEAHCPQPKGLTPRAACHHRILKISL